MKAMSLALLGVFALLGFVAYSYLKPPATATEPIEAVAREQAANTVSSATVRVFQIDAAESQARFVIDEVLRGAPKTVVGATSQVAGQIAVDPADLDSARVGPILINARTFATDSGNRDRAIQNQVLQTDQHEYVSFTPTELVGLPDRIAPGETYPLRVSGELSLRGVSRPATFEATVTPESANRLKGSASTTIRYADWGITIPQVPAVTGVSDDVQLQLDFVATAS